MKNKKIVFLSLGLLLIVTTLVVSIAAWLTDTGTTGDTTFTVGDVSYTLSGGFKETSPIVPGHELVTTEFALTNSSTVDSELRVKVDVTRKQGSNEPAEITDFSSIFSTEGIKPGAHFSLAEGWTLNAGDNYWYYSIAESSVIAPNDQVISLLQTLMFDGYKVGNEYANDVFNFKLTFQAKQADYIDWSDLGTVDFELGT